MLHAQKEVQRVQGDIVRLERFVERFRYKKDKAKQAQAKLTHIGRLEKERQEATAEIALLSRKQRSLGFEFLKPARSGRIVVEADALDVAIGERVLLHDASFALERGEHVALVGPNGSGKTTLLEMILGRREPRSGRVRLGHGVEVAYFSQQELELDTRGSVLMCVQTMTGLSRPDAQGLLGKFLFSGWDEHEKPVAVLSGGERRRLALAVTGARASSSRSRRRSPPAKPRSPTWSESWPRTGRTSRRSRRTRMPGMRYRRSSRAGKISSTRHRVRGPFRSSG